MPSLFFRSTFGLMTGKFCFLDKTRNTKGLGKLYNLIQSLPRSEKSISNNSNNHNKLHSSFLEPPLHRYTYTKTTHHIHNDCSYAHARKRPLRHHLPSRECLAVKASCHRCFQRSQGRQPTRVCRCYQHCCCFSQPCLEIQDLATVCN